MKTKAFLAAGTMLAASMVAAPAPAAAQADPFLGQMMLFGGNFCPRGWTAADGKLLPISQYTAVFSLLGTMYGGDGRTTFAVPDLRGRAPISVGRGPGLPDYRQGQIGGTTTFTLTVNEMPSHTHSGTVKTHAGNADTNSPLRNTFAFSTNNTDVYSDAGGATNNMARDTLLIQPAGGGQAVSKVSPYVTLQWCVALQGIFPSRN